MTSRGRPWTLRGKLTAWSTVVLLGALVMYSAVVYVSLRHVLWHELDQRLHNDIETLEGLLQPFWAADGLQLPIGQSPLDNDDYRWFQVWSRDGRLLFASSVARATPITALTSPPADRALSLELEDGGTVRVKEESGHIAGHPVVVRALASEARLHQEIAEFLWLVGLALPVVVAVMAFGGYRLVKRTMHPWTRWSPVQMQLPPRVWMSACQLQMLRTRSARSRRHSTPRWRSWKRHSSNCAASRPCVA